MLLRRVTVLVAVLAIPVLACSKSTVTEKDKGQKTTDLKAKVCGTFEGGKMTATWTECPDKVRRQVKCSTFIDQLRCDCYEDGVMKHFFMAKDPPMETREDATRVANANCRWALESP